MAVWRIFSGDWWMGREPEAIEEESFSDSPYSIDRMLTAFAVNGYSSTVGRTEALSVPAVLRGRNLICSIATLPLNQVGPNRQVIRNPLLEQIDPDVPNVVTLAQTVEDLLFEGVSWWLITASGSNDYPVSARHLDVTSVSLQPPANGHSPAPLPSGDDPRGAVVYVDGKPTPWSQVIMFSSPNPGLLKAGGRAIRTAILLDKAASMYARDPRPIDFFTPVEGADPAGDVDIAAILENWIQSRQERGTAYVPAALKYNSVDIMSPADLQLVELQKRASLDIANALGLDPEDLGISTTSRTYQNATDRRQDRINDTLSPYLRAVTDRLSMGDVTRRGHSVRFDTDDYLRADPRTRADVYREYLDMGVIDVNEIRAEEGLPGQAPGKPTPVAIPAAGTEASGPASETFDEESAAFTADLPMAEFAVDVESRIITGLALPYGDGAVAKKQFRSYRFAPGSMEFSSITRVKLLRDHDYAQAIGRATRLEDTPDGFRVAFKVARGEAGDQALNLADDGVLDGLSVGVDFVDTIPDPQNKNVTLVRKAILKEVSLTAFPAFDSARLTSVSLSTTEGETMSDIEPASMPDTSGLIDLDLLAQKVADRMNPDTEKRTLVAPRAVASTFVAEPVPYRFDRGGNFLPTQHVFSADLHAMARANDSEGDKTDAGKRVMDLVRQCFATVVTTDVNELNPNIQRPDMYVDQRDYRTPLWDFVNRGTTPNGVQPFTFPKYSSSSGLVAAHVEGTEPTPGAFITTSQTVTPTALSGKASLTREVWDMGGNPAVSTLIFNQMRRGWYEGLEAATATFLGTLTAATDIALGNAVTDEQLANAWDAALAELQFVRNYDFSALALEKQLYKAFVAASDNSGRKLYPILGPMNANGTAASRFRTLDLSGVTGVPSWALPAVSGSANSSWLFDPNHVHGWASAPQRLEFPGTAAGGGYAPVAMVDLAIWGYKAFANTDIDGVREVTYDNT